LFLPNICLIIPYTVSVDFFHFLVQHLKHFFLQEKPNKIEKKLEEKGYFFKEKTKSPIILIETKNCI